MSVLAVGCLSQDVNVATGEDGVAKAAAITQMKPLNRCLFKGCCILPVA